MNGITAPGGSSRHKVRPRWDATGGSRLADFALLVRDPGPMVIRNEWGRSAAPTPETGGACTSGPAAVPPGSR